MMKWASCAFLVVLGLAGVAGVAAAETKSTSKSASAPRFLTKTSDVKATKLGTKGEEYPLVDSNSIGSDKASLTMIRAKGKVTVKKHGHTTTEILVVLAGKVTITGDSRTDSVAIDETTGAWIPPGREHALNVEGSSGTPAAVLVFHAPGATLTDKPGPVQKHDWGSAEALPILGGKGTAKILFDKDNGGDGSAAATWLTLTKGAEVPEHVHADEVEVLWIVKGQGEMTIDGQKMTVTAGMSVAIPPNTKHSFKATEDVSAAQFYAPGGPEQRFKGVAISAPRKPTK